MITKIGSFLENNLELLEKGINSPAFTAIVGAFAGAWAGAAAAQKIAEKIKGRDDLIKEMRVANAAIVVCAAVCDSVISLKRQHVKALKEDFDVKKKELAEFLQRRDRGQLEKDEIFSFVANLQTLSPLPLPLEVLQKQVFEQLSLAGRPLRLQIVLNQSVHSLNVMIEKRNQLIEFYKSDAKAKEFLLHHYFGHPRNEVERNEDYPTVIDAIAMFTDSVIFFSHLLSKDLTEHGNELSTRFKKNFRGQPPSITSLDYSQSAELIPDDAEYQDWFTGFVKKTKPKSFTQKAIARFWVTAGKIRSFGP